MKKTVITGGILAVLAALAVLLGEAWDLQLVPVVLIGLGVGAAIALVDDRSLLERVLALVVGVAITWAGYGVRAGVLPDSDLGRAVDFAVIIGALTVVAVVSMGRLPLWALLAGMAALAGSYETTFTANPTLYTSESVSAVTAVLLTLMLGVVGGSFLDSSRPAHRDAAAGRRSMEDAR